MTRERMRRTRVRTARSGFTLLEILLVVGLLALLAAFAIPALSNSAEKAKIKLAEAAVKSNGTLSQCIEQYKFDVGRFPEELKYLYEKPGDDTIAKKWNGPYIRDPEGFKDPWNNDFRYAAPGTHNEKGFDVWSTGPDGVDGNEDDIRNWKTD